MSKWFAALCLVGTLAVASCGDDDGGGGFCELGTEDCGCHPGFGCGEGLTCTEIGCVDCTANPSACMSMDGGT